MAQLGRASGLSVNKRINFLTKVCFQCKQEKEHSLFRKSKTRKNGIGAYCLDCSKVYDKQFYNKNKQNTLKRKHANKQRYKKINREIVRLYKKKCCLCKENRFECLDFHHIDPSTKICEIAIYAQNAGPKKLKEEILKCVVLCANCHRLVGAKVLSLDDRVS